MNYLKNATPFIRLGQFLRSEAQRPLIEELIQRANQKNNWFTPPLVKAAIDAIAQNYLDESNLKTWLSAYQSASTQPQKVGVVMAGNVPAVGFHDALCVLISGHHLIAKLSSDDQVLMQFLLDKLIEIEPIWANRITIADRLNAADAYIATGSDNTARYFEYYFAKKPHLIRRNRTSVAVLTGHETPAELAALSQDILQYFGLGCRNVSKLFVPPNYDFRAFYEAIEPVADTYRNHHKYFNNYEYNRSVLLINREPHLDNGFLMLRENDALVSPISVLFFEYYENKTALAERLTAQAAKIQCVVSRPNEWEGSVPFGQAQSPSLSDYADGVDTMAFLGSIAFSSAPPV